MSFDVLAFRESFLALKGEQIYLDSATTSLKPRAVADAVYQYFAFDTASVLRSNHNKANQITHQTERAREGAATLINADTDEVVWTKSTTESINLIAKSYGESTLKPNDEIIVSTLEHHSNLLPWMQIAKKTGAKIIKWQLDDNLQLSIQNLTALINERTKIIAVTQMSNVTGFMTDVTKIAELAHQNNAVIVVDGAQGLVHSPLDVKKADVDFYVFSAHKFYGPTGLGVLYGKRDLLNKMPAWQSGGKMLKTIDEADFTPADLPNKFEAGTPNISALIGFNAALNWLQTFDYKMAIMHSQNIAIYAYDLLSKMANITIYSAPKSTLISFTHHTIHHNDLAILLAEQNIAVRTGELCAKPLMQHLNISGVVRISIMPYNTKADIDRFILAFKNAISLLAG